MFFILHMINITIKLIEYNDIPCFKYLNQAFCALSFSFIRFTKLTFILGGYLYSNQKMKIQFYPTD